MVNQQRLVEEFLELVQVDSESKFEAEIAKVLKTKFGALELSVEEDDSMSRSGCQANNLMFTLPASAGGEGAPTIYFTCHMDTVVPGKGIKPQIGEDGVIRSDGTTILGSDDKAGIAAMLELVRVLKEDGIPHGVIKFVITAGEESTLLGSRAMNAGWVKADYGYAIDSNGDVGGIAVAAPFQSKLYIDFTGKTAHAGVNPEAGVSAITVAAKAVARMKLGRIDKETTANFGTFFAKGETNIVAEKVQLIGEARSLVREKLEAQVESMKAACQAVCEEMGATFDFRWELAYPGYKYDESAPHVKLAMDAISNLGLTPKLFHSGGGSDANLFNSQGIPTVNLSVGYQAIHSTSEHIAIRDLVKVAEVVVEIAKLTGQAKK
ncbi:M20/M25/M40 family metallo-hydrolase [Gorillibacterium sp. sgz5001074]|uniref:M20/M25/M40 family metallo-hydrolase n=1 Tax=Gorillibacterium sp. sgz5001074 TaxID=3446695 RepID=UPI003F675F42